MSHNYTGILTKEIFEAVHHTDPSTYCLILRALFMGLEVELGGFKCRLFETIDNGYRIAAVNDGQLLNGFTSLTLESFFVWCNQKTPDELAIIAANVSLNEIRQTI